VATLPVAIDSSIPVAALSGAFGVNVGGPWQFGGALYVAVTDRFFSAFTAIYKSTNSGVSWSPLDTAHQPHICAAVNFDGNHSLVACYPSGGNEVESGLNFRNFDLSAQTWGAAYGTVAAPTGFLANLVGFRPDGSTVVIYQHFVNASIQDGFFFASYLGGWSAGIEIDLNYNIQPNGGSEAVSLVIDPAGNTHVFMALAPNSEPTGLPWNVFYQEITPANALGSFFTFPPSNNGNLISVPVPVVIGTQLFVPAFVSDAGAVGYFLGSGSTWGAVVGPIDPGLASDPTLIVFTSSTPGFAAIVNGALYVVYTAQGSNTAWIEARMRLLQANPSNLAGGFTGKTLTDVETYPASLLPTGSPTAQRILGLGPYNAGGVLFNMFLPQSASFDFTAFFLPVTLAPPAPPATFGVKITLRGVNRRRCDPQESELMEIEGTPPVKQAV
jgi:hypothetical protein